MPACLFGAVLAHPIDLDLRVVDRAERPDGSRDSEFVKLGAFKVADQAALFADVVVVAVQVGVEAHSLAARSDRGYKPEVIEKPESAVDGVERHGRHSWFDRPEDGFRIGVFLAGSDLAEDLETLMCQFHA